MIARRRGARELDCAATYPYLMSPLTGLLKREIIRCPSAIALGHTMAGLTGHRLRGDGYVTVCVKRCT